MVGTTTRAGGHKNVFTHEIFSGWLMLCLSSGGSASGGTEVASLEESSGKKLYKKLEVVVFEVPVIPKNSWG